MKNHTKFLLGNRPYEALKKTFWKNCYFPFKKIIGRSPKEFKEVFGQKHPNKKIIPVFIGKNTTKRNIEKTMWQNRLISKKKSSLERRCNKSVGFYALFGVVGGVLRSGKRVCILECKCGFLCPFWACRGGLRRGKRACILEQECGFPCPFWACRGGLRRGKRACILEQWASWGRPRRGKRASSWRFQDGDEEENCFISSLWFYLIPLILRYLIPLKHRVVRGKKLKKGHLLKGCSWGPNSLKEDTCWSVLSGLFVRAKKLEKGHLLKCPFGVVREG